MTIKKLFLSCGAMKAGTTFLFNALNRHPGIYFTPEKELHFFAQTSGLSRELRAPLVTSPFGSVKAQIFGPGDILSPDFRRHRLSMVMHNRFSRLKDPDEVRKIVCWYADRYMTNPINDDWFYRVFEEAGDRYAADFSNYHALLGNSGWDHVKSVTDELKVIYVLRNPVNRLWSHIKFHYIQAGRRADLDNFTQSDLEAILREGSISAHARYGDIVENLQENLDETQLKVLVFEDFTSDFTEAVRQVENFLGLPEHHYRHVNPERKANASEDIPIPGSMREAIQKAVEPQMEKLQKLGVNLPEKYFG